MALPNSPTLMQLPAKYWKVYMYVTEHIWSTRAVNIQSFEHKGWTYFKGQVTTVNTLGQVLCLIQLLLPCSGRSKGEKTSRKLPTSMGSRQRAWGITALRAGELVGSSQLLPSLLGCPVWGGESSFASCSSLLWQIQMSPNPALHGATTIWQGRQWSSQTYSPGTAQAAVAGNRLQVLRTSPVHISFDGGQLRR